MSLSLSLEGKRALICGASAGIGRATALQLAEQGAHCILLARRAERLESLKAEIVSKGGSAEVLVGDLDQRDTTVASVEAKLSEGPIHILINNAGGPKGGPILNAAEEEFVVAFGRHVLAAHRLTQTLLSGMKEAGYGRIINIISTSVYEPIPNPWSLEHHSRRHGFVGEDRIQRTPPGITINNVLPGFTDTERLSQLKKGRATKNNISEDTVHAHVALSSSRRAFGSSAGCDWILGIPSQRIFVVYPCR